MEDVLVGAAIIYDHHVMAANGLYSNRRTNNPIERDTNV
jgi:hypothetical protein